MDRRAAQQQTQRLGLQQRLGKRDRLGRRHRLARGAHAALPAARPRRGRVCAAGRASLPSRCAAARRPACRAGGIVAAGLCLVAGVGILAAWLGQPPAASTLEPDANAQAAPDPSVDPVVPKGSFRLVLNQAPVVQEGSRSLNIEFQNPAANAYGAQLAIALDDGGEDIAQTEQVKPGDGLGTVDLRTTLAPGTYPAQVRVALFDGSRAAGAAQAAIEIRVL